ncbi:hypothetical protein RR48_13929 [Papilio machaon]|uniref:TIL domain-containing protein n=1 Tax=Papilio machaon TaxID=76193 RepID=A0A194RGX9_PAPMA|nr:hypothetical protein RR48_13929 [Papilio machaon]
MKNLIVLLFVTVSAYCVAGQGIPIAKCPPGEHSVLYCPRQAEPSCDNPKVHDPPAGFVGACDIPDCFCDVPTVRDVKTKKCVLLSECS